MTIDEHERATMLDPLGPQPGDDEVKAVDVDEERRKGDTEERVTVVDLDTPNVDDDRPTMVDGDVESTSDDDDAPTDLKAAKGPARRPKADLTGSQKKRLRGLAHHLDALVRIGKEGVTGGIAGAVSDALETHELIKVRVLEGAPMGRRDAAVALASACGAHVVGQVGRIVILYRRHPKKPQIPIR